MLRGGCTTSTTCSNGTSWCPYPDSVVSFTCSSSSATPCGPLTLSRNASVFTKKPISPSTSVRCRFATGTPSTTSSCPLNLDSTTDQAPHSTMNNVASCRRASCLSPSLSFAPRFTPTAPPRKLCTAGRPRSVGSSSSTGASFRCSFQYCSCRLCTSPLSH